MHYQRFILLAVVALSTLCRGETTNTFGIYLTTGPVDPRLLSHGRGDWSAVRLAESPVISATDIISYDFAEHAMKLRPEGVGQDSTTARSRRSFRRGRERGARLLGRLHHQSLVHVVCGSQHHGGWTRFGDEPGP